jgi:hypothetical protein
LDDLLVFAIDFPSVVLFLGITKNSRTLPVGKVRLFSELLLLLICGKAKQSGLP